MNHQETRTILSDLLAGDLDETSATAAWAHVAACSECQNVIPALHQVRSAVAARGPALFSAHPSADDIVQFALADAELPIPDMARIGGHVQDCPDCQRAVELTRRADAATRAPRRHLWAILDPTRALARWPRLTLAFAAMVVLLAYPAYQGASRLPVLERARAHAVRDLESLRISERALRDELDSRLAAEPERRSWAGPARLLFLAATTRGDEATPSVERFADQLYQPIVIGHRPFTGSSPSGTIEIRLQRQRDGVTTWSERRPVADLWDPAHASLVLLVPASALSPGEHRLEIRRGGETSFSSGFTVTQETPAKK